MPSKERLAEPGYTPPQSEVGEVMDWLLTGDEATSRLAERALVSANASSVQPALARLETAEAPQRVRIVRLLGRIAQRLEDPRFQGVFEGALEDSEPRVVRAAIVALGKLPSSRAKAYGAESALIEALPRLAAPERRACIEALGKVGGADARRALDVWMPEGDVERALLARARTLLERTCVELGEADRIRLDVPIGDFASIVVIHRRGLAEIVSRQLAGVAKSHADGPVRRVLTGFSGSLGELLRARSILSPGLAIELRQQSDLEFADSVVNALCREHVLETLERLTSTTPRLRFTFPREGHQRALLWALSEKLAARTQRLQAHPKAALWDVEIERTPRSRMTLVPQRYEDPRFTYRVREISGASHPTIAAALAHVLEVHEDDVIWDPFVGSGLELIECAIAGNCRELIGTDNNARALDAAAANVEAAKLSRIRLLNADARTATLRGLTGIVTNPPLGVRHRRDGMLDQLLSDVLTNARRNLLPGGRIVWLSPMPALTARWGEELGFSVERRGPVDVGGLTPELQVMRLAPASGRSWRP